MSSISISYCGGCNEGYSRTALVGAILARLQALPDSTLELVASEQAADMQLIVCGCMAMCLAYRQRESLAGVCHLIAPDHLDYGQCPQAEIIERVVEEFRKIKPKRA